MAEPALPARLPVIQAPIGSAATPALAAAVGEAGGLGMLAGSWTEPADLRAAIADVRRRTRAPFGVNLVLAFEQDARVRLLAEERVPVATLSWGVRADHVATLRAAGCRVLIQVGTAADAAAAIAAGADALILQGVEAGGHVEGTGPLLALVGAVRATTALPLVAAGGIADAASAAEARAAGADAVAAGTRFVATREAAAADLWKDAIVAARADDAVLTGLFDVGWPDAPHRCLANSTFRAWEAAGRPAPGARPGEGEAIGEVRGRPIIRYSDDPPVLEATGDLEAMCLYAGRSAGLVDGVVPAAEAVAALADGLG